MSSVTWSNQRAHEVISETLLSKEFNCRTKDHKLDGIRQLLSLQSYFSYYISINDNIHQMRLDGIYPRNFSQMIPIEFKSCPSYMKHTIVASQFSWPLSDYRFEKKLKPQKHIFF